MRFYVRPADLLMTGDAYSHSRAVLFDVNSCVQFVKWVTLFAVSLVSLMLPAVAAQNIHVMTHRLDVSRITAAADTAKMIKFLVCRDGTEHPLVRHDVTIENTTEIVNDPIARLGQCADPEPASTHWLEANVSLHSFQNGNASSLILTSWHVTPFSRIAKGSLGTGMPLWPASILVHEQPISKGEM